MNISIIIPVYKVEQYVEACIKSVMKQTYIEKVECIVIDDCTPDRSMEIVEEMMIGYEGKINFKLLYHKQNQGLSAARNTGVRAAEGKWLYFLDSDDEILPCCLEKMMEMAEKYEPDFVIGGVRVSGSEEVFPILSDVLVIGNQKVATDFFLGKWNTMAWNKLIQRNFLFQNNLFFKEGLLHEDMPFSCALALHASSMCCIKEETYCYKVRKSNSITSDLKAKNYRDMVSIISMNAMLVKGKFHPPFPASVFQYFFIHTYSLALKISCCLCLEKSEKELLYNKLKQILRMFPVDIKSCSLWNWGRRFLFLYCPPGLLKKIFQMYKFLGSLNLTFFYFLFL